MTAKSLALKSVNAIDFALIAPFYNDLEGMTPAQIDTAIREAEDQLTEIEPWLEALTAWRRKTNGNTDQT